MNRFFWLMLLATAMLSGCGDVQWFPDNSSSDNPISTTSPTLIKSYNPAAVLTGGETTLTFTIINATGNPAQTGLGFTDQLATGLTVTAATPQCGGTVTTSGSQIVFSGGQLAVGTANCNIAVNVTAATDGSYTNKATDITGLAGGLVNGVTNQKLTVYPAAATSGTVTVSNLQANGVASGGNIEYTFTLDGINTGATDAGITIDVIGVDSTGADITTTERFLSTAVSANTTTPTALSPPPVTLSSAEAATILFWRIVKVTLN